MATIEKILGTNGSVAEIRGLGISNSELISAASEVAAMPGYHGKIECEEDAVTGELMPSRERVTNLKALASAIYLAQQ